MFDQNTSKFMIDFNLFDIRYYQVFRSSLVSALYMIHQFGLVSKPPPAVFNRANEAFLRHAVEEQVDQ